MHPAEMSEIIEKDINMENNAKSNCFYSTNVAAKTVNQQKTRNQAMKKNEYIITQLKTAILGRLQRFPWYFQEEFKKAILHAVLNVMAEGWSEEEVLSSVYEGLLDIYAVEFILNVPESDMHLDVECLTCDLRAVVECYFPKDIPLLAAAA